MGLAEWLAEQSTLTGYEPGSLIDISSEHTAINFPSRKASCKTVTSFARFSERRPPDLSSAPDGSLDISCIWQHWARKRDINRQDPLLDITCHAFARSGKRRFLLGDGCTNATLFPIPTPLPTPSTIPRPGTRNCRQPARRCFTLAHVTHGDASWQRTQWTTSFLSPTAGSVSKQRQ